MKYPVFMYHAFAIDGIAPKDADLHYSISFDQFKQHIEVCKNHDFKIISLLNFMNRPHQYTDNNFCFFTFDDGHISNYEVARFLAENGYSADFFVNTSMLNKTNFLSVQHLQDMHSMGMSIQTHGHEHKYFNDLPELELEDQFSLSLASIKLAIGTDVCIFSPPGGRINRKVIDVAKKAGIAFISTSRPGLFTNSGNMYDIPRLPILNTTDSKIFSQLLTNSNHIIFKLKLKYYVGKVLKIIMGNYVYEKFRHLVLS